MNFEIINSSLSSIKADLEIIIVLDGALKHKFVQDKKLLKKAEFKGTQDEVCHLIEKNRLYVGTETLKGVGIRSAVAVAIRSLIGKKAYKTVKIATYLSHPRCSASLRAMVEGIILGSYTFNNYKSTKVKCPVKNVEISLDGYNDHELSMETAARAVHNGDISGNATNFTRDIVNTTPDDCYPETMANIAEKLAENSTLKCKVLKPKALKKEKMETLACCSTCFSS